MKPLCVLTLLVLVFGCSQELQQSKSEGNLSVPREFLALASSDRGLEASKMAHEDFEFRWMGFLQNSEGDLELSLNFDKKGYFEEFWQLVDESLPDGWQYKEIDGFGGDEGATLLVEGQAQGKNGEYNNHYAYVFKMSKGKITSLKEYSSDLLVALRVYDYKLVEAND